MCSFTAATRIACCQRYIEYVITGGGVEDTRLEAKDSPSEDRPSRGQGQECSRPRTKDTGASVKKKSLKQFFQAFKKNRSEDRAIFEDLRLWSQGLDLRGLG